MPPVAPKSAGSDSDFGISDSSFYWESAFISSEFKIADAALVLNSGLRLFTWSRLVICGLFEALASMKSYCNITSGP